MHVSTYFGKLKVLWDELNNHEPLLSCSCGLCTCDLGQAHEKRRENDRLHQFLLGLNSDYYGQLCSTLLSQDPLPSLNRAFQQAVQEERVRGISSSKDEKPNVLGFAIRTEGCGRGRVDRSTRTCTYCKKSGHDVTTCFELHDIPDWWYEKFGNRNDAWKTESRSNSRNNDFSSSSSSLGVHHGGVLSVAPYAQMLHHRILMLLPIPLLLPLAAASFRVLQLNNARLLTPLLVMFPLLPIK
ncbi:hypothetical protein RND81_13G127800 [Saponaria officinalis]|uniref:Uncharacterized protein n=1 Tax=Saponaria officinalis TaxID=3572 RepID=A0AAW1GZC0_SAPOF